MNAYTGSEIHPVVMELNIDGTYSGLVTEKGVEQTEKAAKKSAIREFLSRSCLGKV